MIADQLYAIELPKDEDFLSSGTNLMVVVTIFQRAITKYISIYHKKQIPLSFLEFYITEIKNYDYMFKKTTKDFFELYDKVTPKFDLMAEIYRNSYFSQISDIKTKKGEKFLVIPTLDIIDNTEEMVATSTKEVADTISNVLKITEHINNSDEIVDYTKCYEGFIISKIIRNSEFEEYSGKSKVILNIFDNSESSSIISATKRAERLTGERLNLSKQKGKVTKLIIPKLKLPTSYPKTTTFNRFNSEYYVRNFVSASRQILILNDLKINGVSYTEGFVEKRKAMNEA